MTRVVRKIPRALAGLALAHLSFLGGCAPLRITSAGPPVQPSAVGAAEAVMAGLGGHPTDPLPGYVGAMGVGNAILHSGAFGFADVERGRLATTRTRFRIYSTSKSIGAVAAMMLVESGQLDLDKPIVTYLPGLPAHVGKVTVRHLLSHRSGIRHYREGEWNRVSAAQCEGPQEALSTFIGDPLQFEPGSGYQYSTYGYVLLSAVLEAASGQSFDTFARTRIFEPAGMVATAIEGRVLPGFEVATFYDPREGGIWKPTLGVNASCKFFGGGLVSTAEDLVRFGLALVNGRLVRPESLAQMLTIYSEDGDGKQPPYGFGFFPGEKVLTMLGVPVEEYVPSWWHGGNGRGGYSVLIIYPERRAAAAILTNVKASGRLVPATHALAVPFLKSVK